MCGEFDQRLRDIIIAHQTSGPPEFGRCEFRSIVITDSV